MSTLAPLFKKYDIRGRASGPDAPLTAEIAHAVGLAFGAHLRSSGHSAVAIGCDNRLTSPPLAAAAASGLADAGVAVTDIGMVATPVLYWYTVQRGGIGGLMITGSHLPPDQNGFKLSIGTASLYGDQIAQLHQAISGGVLHRVGGGSITHEAVISRYADDLAARVTLARPLRIAADCGSGTASLILPELLPHLSQVSADTLFCESDGTYPHHHPDPSRPENMAALGAHVRQIGADIGLAFDGDADRVGVVDETGAIIAPDRLLALLALDTLTRHPGAEIIADVTCSQVVFDAVAGAGGQPIIWPTGHSLIKARMRQSGAPLAGEISGHIFIADGYYGYDDGFFAALRLLEILSRGDQPLSALDARLPRLFSTPVYRPHCPPELMQPALEAVQTALAGRGEQLAIDGLRFRFERGWGIIRASNTEPVLSMRFEGQTESDALQYRDWVFAALQPFPAIYKALEKT